MRLGHSWSAIMSDNDTTGRRNAAIEAGRLFESDVDEGERCHGCGELLHPYPAPKYLDAIPPAHLLRAGWPEVLRQFPETCMYRHAPGRASHACTTDGEETQATGSVGPGLERAGGRAAAELPNDLDDLLAAAMAAVVEIDAAVMCGDGAAAELAGDRYEATIWMLNGGANFGCMADENAAG